MFDKDHYYDLRDLPVGHWSTSKLQMTKNSIWMHFHEPNSKKFYNISNPIDFKKPYIPPPRTSKSKPNSSMSLSSGNNSPRYVCNNDNFAITCDNLQIMNEEDAYKNPKPIIPVVGTYGQKITPKAKLRSKTEHKTLRELATIPTTSRKVRTIRALTSTPNNASRSNISQSNLKLNEIKKSRNSNRNQNSKSNNEKDSKIYFSLKKGNEDNQTEINVSNLNTETGSKNSTPDNSNIADINSSTANNSNLKTDLNDDELDNDFESNDKKIIFVHSSQEDREAAQAKRTLQVLERKERKYDPQIPSFTVCGDTTVISNSADIDSNISTNKAIIYSGDLPDPPLYIDKRYGDNGHRNPLRISQIEIRKQFKEALENGKLDDYDSDYEYEVDEMYNDEASCRSRPSTAKKNQHENRIRIRKSSRSKCSSVNARRKLYNTRNEYRNDENDDEPSESPMLSRKQYFVSASKVPNIGSLASDM